MFDFIVLLATFIPLSVDDPWKISVGHYHLRIAYFAVALWLILRANKIPALIRALWQDARTRKICYCLMLLAATGFIGIALSYIPKRSAYFCLWAVGTLFTVPYLFVPDLFLRFRQWVPRLLILNLIVHSLFIINDFFRWRMGLPPIAHVMVYTSSNFGNLVRPHAWYQEPGYFAGFALLSIFAAYFWMKKETETRWKAVAAFSILVGAIAIILSTSRMGWIGLAWLLFCFIIGATKKFSKKQITTASACFILLAVITAFIGKNYFTLVYHHVGQGLVNPSEDGSFIFRYGRLKAAKDVFYQTPIFGAGPGGSGAWYAHRFPNGDLAKLRPIDPESLSNDPLSQNLYTEVLSEWGIVGFLSIIGYFYFLLLALPLRERLAFAVLLLILASSWQTLARFDLWFAIGICVYWGRPNSSKKIAITGGAGFIGTHLANRLVQAGHNVFSLDIAAPKHAIAGVEYILGDVRDQGALANLITRADAIFHFAAVASVVRCEENPEESYKTNTEATRQLAALACQQSRKPKIIFSGSSVVYGASGIENIPIDESTPLPKPLSNYGAQKLESEKILFEHGKAGDFPVINFRFFNVYGKGQDPKSPYSGVISIFSDRVKNNLPLELHGAGKQTRDFVAVEDLVEACINALDLPNAACDGNPINLGSGKATTIRELAQLILELVPDSQSKLVTAPARKGDVPHSLANIERAKSVLNWFPKISLADGLEKLLKE